MPKFEQVQKQKRKQTVEQVMGTFPEGPTAQVHGGGDSDTDDIRDIIDRDLRVAEIIRGLATATGIEAV